MKHNHIVLYVHLVWRTWDSQPLIAPEVERRLHQIIEAEARGLDCQVLAVGGTTDHIHLLMRLPATLSVSELVKQVKGTSSRFANEVLLPGRFKWQGHYGAQSVSPQDVEMVKAYVKRQKEHHSVDELLPELEASSLEVKQPQDSLSPARDAPCDVS